MTALFSRASLDRLLAGARPPCVTVTMPVHDAPEAEQDRIRLKNLLVEAAGMLEGAGAADPDAVLAPGRMLLANGMDRARSGDGLALIMAPGAFRRVRLPYPVEEGVVVGDRPAVMPLLPLLSGDGLFFVLALSQKRVRLLACTRTGAREVDLEDIPESLVAALGYDWDQKSLQFHSGGRRGPGKEAIFHGHGDSGEGRKDEIARFCRVIDDGLAGIVDRQAPLVLAAVPYVQAIFRDVTHHPGVVAGGVKGNPDVLSVADLHTKGWAVVEPLFSEARSEAAGRFDAMHPAGRASGDPEAVLSAAHSGRVATLFVATDARRWGRFDVGTGSLSALGEQGPGSVELHDLAAFEALKSRATVFAAPADDLPVPYTLAATFRY